MPDDRDRAHEAANDTGAADSPTAATQEPTGPMIANRPEDALLADWRQSVMCLSDQHGDRQSAPDVDI
jgi:hypothetical protein